MPSVEEVFGKRYKDACLSKLKFSNDVNEKIHGWLKKPGYEKHTLLVHGRVGNGKTYFSAAMMNYVNDKQVRYRRFTDYEFISHLKNKMKIGWETIQEAIRISESSDLFILDDLGSIRITEWEHEQIHALIDHRYNHKLMTIIVSNLTRNDFSEKFEPRFVSRIFAKENTIVEVNDEDLRMLGY